jgi:hypothetical protein
MTDAIKPDGEAAISPLEFKLSGWDDARITRATWAFVIIGIVVRIVRYAINPPLWGDEAFVASNFIDRGFLDLIRPLEYHQVCPLFFLWAELAVTKLLGYSELTLRLFPLLCGIASVVLFRHVAGRLLRGVPLLVAVAIFAVSYYPIRHSIEVKPYASDLLIALGLTALAVEWLRRPEQSRWLWMLALAMPLAQGMSHPAVFVAGGLALGLAVPVWKSRRARTILAWLTYGAVMTATFVFFFLLVMQGQAEDTGEAMRRYWAGGFPPWSTPAWVPVWLIDVFTSHAFSYPAGGARGASTATTLLVVAGVAALYRSGRRAWIPVLLAPMLLGLIAALMGRYPFGGSARTMQYAAPAICILAGLGASRLIFRMNRPRLVRIGLGLLLFTAAAPTVQAIVKPYKMIEDHKAREFARVFWVDEGKNAEVACLKRDLGVVFTPKHWELDRSAVYLCNQYIYSPRHRARLPLEWSKVSPEHPLRVVLYNEEPRHTPHFDRWLADMEESLRFRGVERFIPVPKQLIKGQFFEDRYVVYEFVPRPGREAAVAAGPFPKGTVRR